MNTSKYWSVRRSVFALAVVIALAGAAAVIVSGCRENTGPGIHAKEKQLYTCPMHPQIIRDKPGECPICGMNLVPVPKEQAPTPAPGATATPQPGATPAPQPGATAGKPPRKIKFYRSPMNPNQTSPGPKKDEMGMDYVPVYEDEIQGRGPGPPDVSGLAAVTIDPARQQLIGLRTAPVVRDKIGADWRTVADIQVDPTRVRKTNVKVEGFIERIFVDFVGQPVARGQALFSIYSPSLLEAENEYLLALKTKQELEKAGGDIADNGRRLLAAARKKLELWDVPTGEIDRIARTGRASKSLTIVSPISGVVTAKNVVQGAYLNPGDTPYEITDLGSVWVMADAYETDLPQVRVGLSATLTLKSYPNRTFTGNVAFIDPAFNPETRTIKVHFHFDNPTLDLKPGMYAEVALHGAAHDALVIPADAVIHSGTRNVVFVSLGEGKFTPRLIQLGVQSGDRAEVVAGLAENDSVVTRANFLIDSESQLRASLASLGGP
jgi:membrane fusion protein, copper/silver efflux system